MSRSSNRRAFLLALTMLLIPVALLMVFSLTRVIFEETGMSMQAQRRTKAFFVCQAALSTASHALACSSNRAHTHENDGIAKTAASAVDFLEITTLPDHTLDSEGWYTWNWTGGDVSRSFTRCIASYWPRATLLTETRTWSLPMKVRPVLSVKR